MSSQQNNLLLPVHQIGLTTINIENESGLPRFYPLVGIWTDLSSIANSGIPVTRPVGSHEYQMLVVLESNLVPDDPAVMNLVLGRIEPDSDSHIVDNRWLLTVPTSWVGMVTSMIGSGLQCHLMLLDGEPPDDIGKHVVSSQSSGVIVFPAYENVEKPLGMVMNQEWTVPFGLKPKNIVTNDNKVDIGLFLVRDWFWRDIAGISLGQFRGLNRFSEFCMWLDGNANDNGNGRVRCDQILEFLTVGLQSSVHQFFPDDNVSGFVPDRMNDLRNKILETVNGEVFQLLMEGMPAEDVISMYTVYETVYAGGIILAMRACLAELSVDPGNPDAGMSSSYALAFWLNESDSEPWWAIRATHGLLLEHDVEVLANLLSSNNSSSGDECSVLAYRVLHVLVDLLVSLGISEAEIVDRLKYSDVVPKNIDDMIYICDQMVSVVRQSDVDYDGCLGCAAVNLLLGEVSDWSKFWVAVSGLFSVLADLDADLHNLSVGDEDWKLHRGQFLMHWISRTMLVSVADE